ncbi:MAG: SGNH/GDSL hydrolase family protein, partial [bacterium]|nr:SGNH/GDSL hydrolase family protein [bacterium]
MPSHIALLGDSVFDNAAYTGHEPDVLSHLRAMLPASWQGSLLAVDGATTADLALQLAEVTPGVSHLVISLGGNDALLSSDLL